MQWTIEIFCSENTDKGYFSLAWSFLKIFFQNEVSVKHVIVQSTPLSADCISWWGLLLLQSLQHFIIKSASALLYHPSPGMMICTAPAPGQTKVFSPPEKLNLGFLASGLWRKVKWLKILQPGKAVTGEGWRSVNPGRPWAKKSYCFSHKARTAVHPPEVSRPSATHTRDSTTTYSIPKSK